MLNLASLHCELIFSFVKRFCCDQAISIDMGKGYYQRLRPRENSLKNGRRSYNRNEHLKASKTGQRERFFKAQASFAKLHQESPFAPKAPLNTTSYIISAKGRYADSPSRELSLPEFDIYGSMEGLIGVRDVMKGGPGAFCGEKLIIGVKGRSGIQNSALSRRLGTSSVLSLRIHRRDDQIAHLEVESLELRERLICMEEELGILKQRVRILEVSHEVGVQDGHSGDASCA